MSACPTFIPPFLPVAKVLQSPSGKSQCFVAEFGHIVRYVEGAGSWHIDTTLNLTIPAAGLLIPEIREAIGYAKPEVPRKKQYSVPVAGSKSGGLYGCGFAPLCADAQGKMYFETHSGGPWAPCSISDGLPERILRWAQAIRQAGPDGLPPDVSGAVKFEDPRASKVLTGTGEPLQREKPVFWGHAWSHGSQHTFQKRNGQVCHQLAPFNEPWKATTREEWTYAANLRAYDQAAAS